MDKFYIESLKEAEKAYNKNEVPVGCVIVKDNVIIGRGHNLTESLTSAINHAEVIAIDNASKNLNSWRLSGAVLYVTLEPCLMCASLIKKSRIKKVIIGAIDPNEGAFGSTLNINDLIKDNYIESIRLYDENSEKLLNNFFKNLRKKGRDI